MHLFAPFDLPQYLAMFFFSNLTWLLQEQKYLCTQIIAHSVECRFLNKQRSNINLIKVGILLWHTIIPYAASVICVVTQSFS